MRKFGSLIGAALTGMIAVQHSHHMGRSHYPGGGARQYRRSKYDPHQSYRELIRARTKPGSRDRRIWFAVAKAAQQGSRLDAIALDNFIDRAA